MVFTHYLSGFLLMFSFFDECAAFSYTQVFKSQKSTHVGDGGPTSLCVLTILRSVSPAALELHILHA